MLLPHSFKTALLKSDRFASSVVESSTSRSVKINTKGEETLLNELNRVMDYIEEHLTEELPLKKSPRWPGFPPIILKPYSFTWRA